MAIEGNSMLVEMNAGQRVEGLKQAARLRSRVWGGTCETDLARFFAEMSDVRDRNYQENKRALGAIFFLANIKADRHEVDFSELTTDEKSALIRAMIQFRAVVSLFPKRLVLPN